MVEHHTLAELARGYRSSVDPVERSHWHIVWLYHQHRNADTVAAMVGYTPSWVRTLIKRYNDLGEAALKDLRHGNPGNKAILTKEEEQELELLLGSEAAGLGLWTGPKVAAWISEKIQRKVSNVTGWKYMTRLGYSQQLPRPRHRDAASREEQEQFKKKSRKR
jgi:transposase